MQIHNEFEQNTDEWFDFRKGKIAGSSLGAIYSSRAWTKQELVDIFDEFGIEYEKTKTGTCKETLKELEERMTPEIRAVLISTAPKKLGFYEILADQLGIEPDSEDVRERGHRLEPEAADKFAEFSKKELGIVGCCVSDADPRIINSPDRIVVPKKTKPVTEMVEIKCLSRARHLQAICEGVIPEEYYTQMIQYFVVNESLQTLYFVFYDPRVLCKPLHVIEVTRESLGTKPADFLEFQVVQLADLDKLVEELSW